MSIVLPAVHADAAAFRHDNGSAMKDLMKFEVGKLEGYTGPGLNEGGGGGGGGGSSMPFLIVIVLIAAIAYYFMTQKDE